MAIIESTITAMIFQMIIIKLLPTLTERGSQPARGIRGEEARSAQCDPFVQSGQQHKLNSRMAIVIDPQSATLPPVGGDCFKLNILLHLLCKCVCVVGHYWRDLHNGK